MDIFKNIGDFFNGLWGKKKKEENLNQNYNTGGKSGTNQPRYKNVFGQDIDNEINHNLISGLKTIHQKTGLDDFSNKEKIKSNYAKLSDDDKWDVWNKYNSALNRSTQAYKKAETDNDFFKKEHYGSKIKQASDYLDSISGVDRGKKSLFKSFGDWIESGGVAGDLSGGLINTMGHLTGNRDTAQLINQEHSSKNAGNHAGVNVLATGANLVGNTALNLATGGKYGLVSSATNLANAGLDAITDANRGYVVDSNGKIQRINRTDAEKLSDIGTAGLNLGLTYAGMKGLGPNMAFGSKTNPLYLQDLVKNKQFSEIAKGVGKYAAKEIPFATGTTIAETGIRSIGEGNKAWADFSTNLANNIISDVAVDITGAVRQGANPNRNRDLLKRANEKLDQQLNPVENPVQNAVMKTKIENEIRYKIMEDGGGKYVKLDEGYQIEPNTRVGDIGRIIRGRIDKFSNNEYQLGDSNYRATVNDVTKNEVSNKQNHMSYDNFLKKGEMSNNYDELLQTMQNIRRQEMIPSKATQSGKLHRKADHYIKGDVRAKIGDDFYNATMVNEVDKSGNITAYDISKIKKAPRVSNDFSQNRLLEELNNSSVSQDPDSVKMKMSNMEQIGKNDFSEQSLRKIIGEEYDIVTKTPDGNTRNAQGYADLKNGIIAVLDGKMTTANHEATHVAIHTLKQTNPKLADNALNNIIRHYGAEELVNSANKAGYGDTVGHKLDFNNEADVRYAAEERLADDFAKYAEAKAKGRENYYAKKTGLPAQIKAWFDSVIDKLKDMAGRLDSAHNFMYKLERGDFAKVIDSEMRAKAGQDMDVPTTRPQMAYKISRDDFGDFVEVDKNIFDGVPEKNRAKVLKKYIQDNLQGNSYELNFGKDGEAKITRVSTNKITNPHQHIGAINQKGYIVPELPDVMTISQKTGYLTDKKAHSFAKDGFEYRQSRIKIGDDIYTVNLNIGLNNNNKLLYEINNIKKEARNSQGLFSRASHDSNIPQDSDSVKMKLKESNLNNTDEYINEQIKAQKQSVKPGFIQKLKDFKASAKHFVVDDATAYERYMTKAKGKEAKAQKEALRAELRNDIDKVRDSDMIAQQFIRDNGLAELGKLSTKELNQFQQYLIARRHAADLHKKGIQTGRDLDMDLAIIQKYKSKFKNEEKIYRNFNKQLLNYMERNGLISKELHTKLNKNKAYTPYQRLMDDVNSFTGHSQQLGNLSSEQVIKGIKGSERTILNPIEATMANTMRIINEGQRNIAARKIAENVFSENILKEGQKPRADYDTLNFMQDGKKITYEVPKLVASEMKRLNRVLPDGVEKIIKVLSAPAKSLRAGATSLNPMFAASNLVRDQFQTTITGNLKTSLKGAPQAFWATIGLGKKANELRAELSRQGIIGSEYRQTYGYKQGDLMKNLQKEHKLTKKAADKLRHPIDALNDLIGKTEYFTRAQQYFGTEGDTVTKSQAARNNTLNFSRGGEAVMVLNKIIPFLNAGVQGGRQITNQFTKRPVRTTLALTAWAGIAAAAKGFFEAQSDEQKELYARISDYEKRTNLIVPAPFQTPKYNPETGRVDGLIKIPIPQFLYPITDGINNTKGRPEDFLKVASNIFEVFTGLDTENPVNQLTPTAIKPFIEAATNTNMFTGRKIVSEYDVEKAPEDKGAKYTTGAARFLSSLTGVDAPVIDNFIQNWSGGLGKDSAKTLTDNPDNSRDGGGVEKIFTEGAYRRFGSAGAKSQYEMAVESGNDIKKILKNDINFNSLPKEKQEEILKSITFDSKNIGWAFNKAERGEEIKKSLSERQEGLLKGFNSQQYIEQVLEGNKETKRKRLYNENNYEYNEFKKEYDKKIKEGKYSRADKIKATEHLRKLEVGKDFSKETREIYEELDKDKLRKLLDQSENSEEILKKVLTYGDALVDAGIIEKNKFRDKYGNISLHKEKGGRKAGRTGSLSTYKIDTMSLIRGALSNNDLSNKFSYRKYPSKKQAPKARQVAIRRLGGKIKI